MNKMMKLAGAALAATGEVAVSGIVASGAAAYSVAKAFLSAKKRVTDAWTEKEPEESLIYCGSYFSKNKFLNSNLRRIKKCRIPNL